MIIAIDFDGTLVERQNLYSDKPLVLIPGVKDALYSLKRAGHTLILSSCRANLSRRRDWRLDPLWVQDPHFNVAQWSRNRSIHEERWAQMLNFVCTELKGVFDAIDSGVQGKPYAHLYIDDSSVKHHAHGVFNSMDWDQIAESYGEQGDAQ